MRTALLTLLTLLVATAPAQAASVKVSWPDQREYKPGEQIAVTVSAARKVKVSEVFAQVA